jgi:hypothetical protein
VADYAVPLNVEKSEEVRGVTDPYGSGEKARSSDKLIVGLLVASVLLVLTGPGVFAGFVLAVMTTATIFRSELYRTRIRFRIAGLLATSITALFVILWIVN